MLRRPRLTSILILALGASTAWITAGATTTLPGRPEGRSIGGLLIEERRGRIVVVRVLPGSPASLAGLREGDVLLVVENVSLVDLDQPAPRDVFRILDRLRAPSVRLVVGRGASTHGATLPLDGGDASIPASPGGEIVVGMPAPQFTARDLAGEEVSLAALRGRVVLIDFWASWCPPCRDAAIVLRRLADQYGERLAIIGVSLDEDPRAFEAFVYNHHLPGRQIADGGPFGPISVLYGAPAAAIPYSVLISPEGTVLSAGRSLVDKEEIIARLAGSPAPQR